MTQKPSKRFTPWTDKHEVICEKKGISGLAKRLWMWLMRQNLIGEETEPDLSEFNAFIKKSRGKEYDQQYLKKAFELLEESGVIKVVKKYSWKIYRVVCIPLEWLSPPRKKTEKNLDNPEETQEEEPPKAQNFEPPFEQQQQDIIYDNKAYLENEGFIYDETEKEVLFRPLVEIKAACALYKLRSRTQEIPNPEGWLRTCLRKRWYANPKTMKQISGYLFQSDEWTESFGANDADWDFLRPYYQFVEGQIIYSE
jgi:hypothetical protein